MHIGGQNVNIKIAKSHKNAKLLFLKQSYKNVTKYSVISLHFITGT